MKRICHKKTSTLSLGIDHLITEPMGKLAPESIIFGRCTQTVLTSNASVCSKPSCSSSDVCSNSSCSTCNTSSCNNHDNLRNNRDYSLGLNSSASSRISPSCSSTHTSSSRKYTSFRKHTSYISHSSTPSRMNPYRSHLSPPPRNPLPANPIHPRRPPHLPNVPTRRLARSIHPLHPHFSVPWMISELAHSSPH